MNSFLLIFIGIPALELFIMIKIGAQIGALNTISLIFLTAIIGIYFAKQQGLKTIRSGILNLYQNKIPIYEIASGASIGIAALLLIIPGFITDVLGFLILIPITRKILINSLINKNKKFQENHKNKILDGEIVEDKNKDEL
tara:strand:- start:13608 stop:14030 length:423 start_codon:yes stop_codon:yes gene_type:complete